MSGIVKQVFCERCRKVLWRHGDGPHYCQDKPQCAQREAWNSRLLVAETEIKQKAREDLRRQLRKEG